MGFKDFVKENGKTQREIAALLGITEESVSNKARGKTPWKWAEVQRLYKVFGMEVVEVLMDGDE